MKQLLCILTLILGIKSYAADIEISEDELAQESVYPKFDTPTAVKKKNVMTDGKFEFALAAGWTLNDAINNPFGFGGMLTYHLTDIHALQIYSLFFSPSLSSYATQLQSNATFGLSQISQVPKQQYTVFGVYEITPYYGKISITKQTVWNIMIYGTAGVGVVGFQNANNIGFSLGFGQKLYFSNKLSLVMDLRYLIYQGPNPIYSTVDPAAPVFSNQPITNAIATIGLGYLL